MADPVSPIGVECPYCHQPPRQRCRNSDRIPVAIDKTHRVRVRAAEAAARGSEQARG